MLFRNGQNALNVDFVVILVLKRYLMSWYTSLSVGATGVSVCCGGTDKKCRYSGSGWRTRRRKSWASGLRPVRSGVSQFRVPSPTLSSVARSDSPAKGQRHVRLSTTRHDHRSAHQPILYYQRRLSMNKAWEGRQGTYQRKAITPRDLAKGTREMLPQNQHKAEDTTVLSRLTGNLKVASSIPDSS